MAYFPTDIPFMSKEELEKNNINVQDDEQLETELISKLSALNVIDKRFESIPPDQADEMHEILMIRRDIRTMQPQAKHKVEFHDDDHVWIDNKQYISLRKFLEAKKQASEQAVHEKVRPRATVRLDYGNDGRDEKWYIAYSCPTCGITVYPKETACDRCGNFFDWSKSAEIKVSREVVWK